MFLCRAHRTAFWIHYCDVITGAVASQITRLTIVYSNIYSDADQRKHQSSASQAFVRGIHRGPGNSLHKWSVTRKMFPFDDVTMFTYLRVSSLGYDLLLSIMVFIHWKDAVLCLNHITLPGSVRAVPGLLWTKIVRPPTGPVRVPCGAVQILPPRTGPVQFYKCMHYKFTGPVRVWSSLTAPEQPVRPNTTPVRDFYKLRLCQFPHVSVRVPYGTLAGAARDRTGPVGIEKHYIFSYGARTTPARGPRGVLLIIRWNHKCAAVSNRTGPVVWCDHENSNILHF